MLTRLWIFVLPALLAALAVLGDLENYSGGVIPYETGEMIINFCGLYIIAVIIITLVVVPYRIVKRLCGGS